MSRSSTVSPLDEVPLPKGIHADIALPNPDLGLLWNSIVLDEKIKQQLLGQAILNFTLRHKIRRTVIPLHGC